MPIWSAPLLAALNAVDSSSNELLSKIYLHLCTLYDIKLLEHFSN